MSNRIAFINSNGRLGTIGADGRGVRLLSRPDRLYQFPAWSPDSLHIGAIGNNEQGAGVYSFADAVHGEQLALYQSVSEAPFYLYWSPDGELLTFIAAHPEDGIGLYAVEATPRTSARLLATGQPCFWCWAPDGGEILCHTGPAGQGQLAILDRRGASRRSHDPPGFFQSPGYSSDGDYLAYAAARDNELSFLVVSRRGGAAVARLPHLGVVALNWSPTESRLAFIAPGHNRRHFYGPLRLLDVTGTVHELVDETVIAFFWSPDGRHIAYLTPEQLGVEVDAEEPGDVMYVNGSSPPRMMRPAGPASLLRLQLWIVNTDNGERRRLLTFQPTALFLNQFLPFFDQYALSHCLWSPAGDALVMPIGNEFGDSSLWITPIDGSEPLRLGAALIGFWSPT